MVKFFLLHFTCKSDVQKNIIILAVVVGIKDCEAPSDKAFTYNHPVQKICQMYGKTWYLYVKMASGVLTMPNMTFKSSILQSIALR